MGQFFIPFAARTVKSEEKKIEKKKQQQEAVNEKLYCKRIHKVSFLSALNYSLEVKMY